MPSLAAVYLPLSFQPPLINLKHKSIHYFTDPFRKSCHKPQENIHEMVSKVDLRDFVERGRGEIVRLYF